MTQWEAPLKPAELAENRLVEAILDGTFPINSSLPPERELAEQLGVTRPTLREVLQRLNRDGWLEIHHGKSTRVRDYWLEGNLMILGTIARHQSHTPATFVLNLLEIRLLLAPTYARLAVENENARVIEFLEYLLTLPDEAEVYAENDLKLHLLLTQLSGNPIFTLIFNGFNELYRATGQVYFASPAGRASSRKFYTDLLVAAQDKDHAKAESIVRQVMQESIYLWNQATSEK
ncbi:MAG: fatty acid metabolism transcriptional regulator FadR [Anaerolineaceae bacterium]|nr:fatty acid metabolism transcriptional regulator FadR [Anaerolineaceae bacterium]